MIRALAVDLGVRLRRQQAFLAPLPGNGAVAGGTSDPILD